MPTQLQRRSKKNQKTARRPNIDIFGAPAQVNMHAHPSCIQQQFGQCRPFSKVN
jgi:hypothetical protein